MQSRPVHDDVWLSVPGGSIGKPRRDRDLRVERAVHGAPVGDLQQALALCGVERAGDLDRPVDAVDSAITGFAFGSIGCVNFPSRVSPTITSSRSAMASGAVCTPAQAM